MSNMSYCRFQNTLQDLRDCAESMGVGEEVEEKKLSQEEAHAKKKLIQLCRDIVEHTDNGN